MKFCVQLHIILASSFHILTWVMLQFSAASRVGSRTSCWVRLTASTSPWISISPHAKPLPLGIWWTYQSTFCASSVSWCCIGEFLHIPADNSVQHDVGKKMESPRKRDLRARLLNQPAPLLKAIIQDLLKIQPKKRVHPSRPNYRGVGFPAVCRRFGGTNKWALLTKNTIISALPETEPNMS